MQVYIITVSSWELFDEIFLLLCFSKLANIIVTTLRFLFFVCSMKTVIPVFFSYWKYCNRVGNIATPLEILQPLFCFFPLQYFQPLCNFKLFCLLHANYVITVKTQFDCTVDIEDSVVLKKKTLKFELVLRLWPDPTKSRAEIRNQVNMLFRVARLCLAIFESIS